jgi:flagellin
MGLRIETNIEAMDAHRNLLATSTKISQSMSRLSSGFRINKAADDAAGLAISEKLQTQVGGLNQAQRNAQDAVSLVQTAEGSMSEVQSMLQRVRDLAVQYNNGTLSTTDHAAITAEIAQLSAEASRIVGTVQFNGISVLAGTATITFQVGANSGETITVQASNMGGTYFDTVFVTAFTASGADIDALDTALGSISNVRASFGAIQNRLEHTIANLSTYEENLSSAESRIRDTDMAMEMTNFTKLQILQQSGMAMLAQANQAPNSVLSLLKG